MDRQGCDVCRGGGDWELGAFERVSSGKAEGAIVACPACGCLYLDPGDGTKSRLIHPSEASRWMSWSPDDVVAAMRTTLGSQRSYSSWSLERAELHGDKILVIFSTTDEHRYGVYYDLADVPIGNNTGRLCATPEEWASEIVLTMDEQIDTGGLRRADRRQGPDGLTVLRWVW